MFHSLVAILVQEYPILRFAIAVSFGLAVPLIAPTSLLLFVTDLSIASATLVAVTARPQNNATLNTVLRKAYSLYFS
jgi:hypothetical protein